MNLNWLQSTLYGFLSGFMDILPVSARAHQILLLKFFGMKGESPLMNLLIHLGVLAALYYQSQAQIVRMSRARALSRIPKRKRKRPLDIRSLMDLRFLQTISVPVILALCLYQYTEKWNSNLLLLSIFLFLNGLILYMPQFFPTGNRDSRTLSRVEGLLMGLGGAISILPGFSAIGASVSIASICGIDRNYSLAIALLMNLLLTVGLLIYDVIAIIGQGLGTLTLGILVQYLFSAICAFCGTMLGIRCMRYFADNKGYSGFGFYCFGMSLITFILNLVV